MSERTHEELADLITLCGAPGIGIARFRALVTAFGSPTDALAAGPAELSAVPGINHRTIAGLMSAHRDETVIRQCDRIAEDGVVVIACTDPDFPQQLAHLDNAPALLFIKGNAGLLTAPGVAIVGTRRPTEYGRQVTAMLTRSLAEQGLTIISGMARGVDGYAHQVALKCGGATIAVLGCGVDVVYPPEARKLHREIAEQGVLVSEFHLGTKPDAPNFPRRNRIISGLAEAVLVIEAPEKSGALITATNAINQGRDVYAVPGPITSEMSAGCNRLIADGAHVVTGADQMLEQLGLGRSLSTTPGTISPGNLALPVAIPEDVTDEERVVLEALGAEPVHIDALCRQIEMSLPDLSTVLTMLEMRQLVESQPGSHYCRAPFLP
jgi:DNA processing protein